MDLNAGDKYFIDTNIIVYSFDDKDVVKKKLAQNIIENSLSTGKGFISFQVVQEFLNVATKKFAAPMSFNDAQLFLGMVLRPLCRVFPSITLYSKSLEISERFKFSFYDSLVIASALESKSRYLLSEDLSNGQKIDDLTIINPFESRILINN